MRNRIITLLATLFLITAPGCEKEKERLDNYLVEFATVLKQDGSYRFRLDNGQVLIPEEMNDFIGNEGQRVILNYVPLDGNTIKVNYASPIFTGRIHTKGFPEWYTDDPVKIQSVWVGGDYLNMIIEIEYHSIAHEIRLFRDWKSPGIDLYFSHSKKDDPPGYPKMMYASFLLSSLRTQSTTLPVPFRLFINTDTGVREFNLELK